MNNGLLFGGKAVVISGDFRQTLPVVRRATRAGVKAYLKSSPLWHHFIQLSLISNMRSEGRNEYNEWLLNVGSANTPKIPLLKPEAVEIPRNMVLNPDENIITSTFGENLENLTEDELAQRVILCCTNREALEINNEIIENLSGEMKIYNSADSIISDDESATMFYTDEFLHELQPSGMPPHELRLKRGAIVMLIRNLNPLRGLCNGSRMVVRNMHENFLTCEILSECCRGDIVFIPRTNLTPSDTEYPFVLKRRQFPIIPAFAVTINKSQGQSYEYVGVLPNEPVFSHGQLYVALSRSRNPDNIKVCIKEGPRQGRLLGDDRYFTENIVYSEVFD